MSSPATQPGPPNSDELRAIRRAVRKVRKPTRFVERVLGATPTPQQRGVLEALDAGKRRIAIRSGHGVGKSALLAWILLWWLSTRPMAVAPCTAPTAHQLEDVLWGEVARWRERMREPFRGLLCVSRQAVRHRAAPDA